MTAPATPPASSDHRFIRRVLLITLCALIVSIFWQSLPLMQSAMLSWRAEPRAVTPRGDLAADEKATVALFEAAKESVVYISTAERVVDPWTRNVLEQPRGTGSGFIWDDLGHVVTNDHVVEGASRAVVRLADGRSFPASLVGVDPAHDLAVLQIGVGTGRPAPLPIGTSSDLKVGQKVFAIGNPFGLDWTLTTGIVSALGRDLSTSRGHAPITGLIQTDAAINPGNSGGPLIDSAGRLIGVNTAIFSPSGASAGIGFSIPVDTVNRVVPQIIAKGHYAPPSIGVKVDARFDDIARRQGVDGVLVLGVEPGSAADRAGVKGAQMTRDGRVILGDAITAIGDQEVSSAEELLAALDRYKIGDTVGLKILRNGQPMEMTVALEPGS